MIAVLRLLSLAVALGGVAACSDPDTRYYKDRIDTVTMDQVVRRYGPPHKSESLDDHRTVWTYYERGSGTASYSGFATGGYCHAYVLTFDRDDILREWQQLECAN